MRFYVRPSGDIEIDDGERRGRELLAQLRACLGIAGRSERLRCDMQARIVADDQKAALLAGVAATRLMIASGVAR